MRVTHTSTGHTETAEIAVSIRPTNSNPAPHEVVASVEAWHAIAASLIDSDPVAAVAAAKRGLDELGHSYWFSPLKDDSSFSISFAEEDIRAGKVADGAKQLTRVLGTRIDLYFTKYKDEIAKP